MIRIYGASDDLVEIEGHPGGDEVGCESSAVVVSIGDRVRGLVVRIEYSPKWAGNVGCWAAAVSPIDEDVPMYPVTIELEPERKYSAMVLVDAPETVALSWKKFSVRR